jgi:hypothetical protein
MIDKMKTVKQWLEQLPDGYRERALENLDPKNAHQKEKDMVEAILASFDFDKTKEGGLFWARVYGHYAKGLSLPPLPSKNPFTLRHTIGLIGIVVCGIGFLIQDQFLSGYLIGHGAAIMLVSLSFEIKKKA